MFDNHCLPNILRLNRWSRISNSEVRSPCGKAEELSFGVASNSSVIPCVAPKVRYVETFLYASQYHPEDDIEEDKEHIFGRNSKRTLNDGETSGGIVGDVTETG